MSLPGETDFHWVWGNLHKVCSRGWNGEGVDGGCWVTWRVVRYAGQKKERKCVLTLHY